MARGEWVMFLDSDDVLSPYAVAVLLEAASRSGTSFVEARWTEGPDTSRIRWADTPAGLPTVFGQEAYIEKVLYQDGACPSVCGKIFARSLFDSGLRFREGILYEDLDIFYLLGRKGREDSSYTGLPILLSQKSGQRDRLLFAASLRCA